MRDIEIRIIADIPTRDIVNAVADDPEAMGELLSGLFEWVTPENAREIAAEMRSSHARRGVKLLRKTMKAGERE